VTSIPLWIAILSIPIGGLIVQRSKTPGLFAGLSYVTAARRASCPLSRCLASHRVYRVWPCHWPRPGRHHGAAVTLLRPEHRITGLGIFGSLYGVIVGTGPWLAGRLAETAQTPAAAVLFGGALFAACVPLMILFEATVRQPTIQRS
jgi:hypothetical protein